MLYDSSADLSKRIQGLQLCTHSPCCIHQLHQALLSSNLDVLVLLLLFPLLFSILMEAMPAWRLLSVLVCVCMVSPLRGPLC
jgi:hypothetical protein